MSTRANVLLVTPNNQVHQFYHHYDGYLHGVGEELRKMFLYSIGMNYLIKDMSIYGILLGEILDCEGYVDEDVYNLKDHNNLHGDIEYLYVIKDDEMFMVNEWDLCDKFITNKELIDYVCKDENKLSLTKPFRRPERA